MHAGSRIRARQYRVVSCWTNTKRRDEGASLVEYALLIALIALVCFVAVLYFGQETGETFSRVGHSVEEA